MFPIPGCNTPLVLLMNKKLMFAELFPFGVDINSRIDESKCKDVKYHSVSLAGELIRKNISPQMLVDNGMFICPDGQKPTWENLQLGKDEGCCITYLSYLLEHSIVWWKKRIIGDKELEKNLRYPFYEQIGVFFTV